MPAAAVIPAPVAYINVVAVKKLVVGFLADLLVSASLIEREYRCVSSILSVSRASVRLTGSFTLKKLECLKQACAMNTLAWNNNIGLRSLFCWFLELK